MPLFPMMTLLQRALEGGYGVGYFEAWDSYSLEAVLEAAEEERSPVILGFGCMMVDPAWLDQGGLEMLAGIGRPLVERARVPVAFLLNEAQTSEQAARAMELGFNAVMLDTSAWSWDESLERVASLVRMAHKRKVAVEAELGHLPDAGEGVINASQASLTDPEQAAEFVERTRVDCLAVSIGNVHLLDGREAPVDIAHLRAIRDRVKVPLVIHGGSSFPSAAVPEAVRHGVVKFNVGTVLKRVFLRQVVGTVRRLGPEPRVHDVLGSHGPADLLAASKQAMKTKVRELIRLYGGSGHGAD